MGEVIRVVRVPKHSVLVEIPIDMDIVKIIHALVGAGFKMVAANTEISGAMKLVEIDKLETPMPTLLPPKWPS